VAGLGTVGIDATGFVGECWRMIDGNAFRHKLQLPARKIDGTIPEIRGRHTVDLRDG
jgi:hypothetical protein